METFGYRLTQVHLDKSLKQGDTNRPTLRTFRPTWSATFLLVRIARVAYRVVEVKVDEDQLHALSEVRARSQGDLTEDVRRVAGRIARRRDGAVTNSRRADQVKITFAVRCTKTHRDYNSISTTLTTRRVLSRAHTSAEGADVAKLYLFTTKGQNRPLTCQW